MFPPKELSNLWSEFRLSILLECRGDCDDEPTSQKGKGRPQELNRSTWWRWGRARARASATQHQAGVKTFFLTVQSAPKEAGNSSSLLLWTHPAGEICGPGQPISLAWCSSRRTLLGKFCFWNCFSFSTHSGGGVHWLVEQILCLNWGERKVWVLPGEGLWHSKGESSPQRPLQSSGPWAWVLGTRSCNQKIIYIYTYMFMGEKIPGICLAFLNA